MYRMHKPARKQGRYIQRPCFALANARASAFFNTRRGGLLLRRPLLKAVSHEFDKLCGNCRRGLENILCSSLAFYNQMVVGRLKANRFCRESFSFRFLGLALSAYEHGSKFLRNISFRKAQIPLEAVRRKMTYLFVPFQRQFDPPEYRLANPAFADDSVSLDCAALLLIRPIRAATAEHRTHFPHYIGDLPY